MLCGDLNAKEIQGRRDICIHVSDSPCCTAEVNNTVKQLHSKIYIYFFHFASFALSFKDDSI